MAHTTAEAALRTSLWPQLLRTLSACRMDGSRLRPRPPPTLHSTRACDDSRCVGRKSPACCCSVPCPQMKLPGFVWPVFSPRRSPHPPPYSSPDSTSTTDSPQKAQRVTRGHRQKQAEPRGGRAAWGMSEGGVLRAGLDGTSTRTLGRVF